MFQLNNPSDSEITSFLQKQQNSAFSYPEVGQSQTGRAPSGYNLDHNRAKLGSGEAAFRKGVEALRSWKMFDIEWLRLCWPSVPIKEGETVAVLIRHFGFWSLNASRIVYVIDEGLSEVQRYGFAYGTLADHAESGEERFMIEWNCRTDQVWYELFAYSRTNHVLAKAGYPIVRWMQRHFARESQEAMVEAVSVGRS